MFGNYKNYDDAVKVAEEKTKELGRKCIVIESDDEDSYTIAMEIKKTSFEEFMNKLAAKHGKT